MSSVRPCRPWTAFTTCAALFLFTGCGINSIPWPNTQPSRTSPATQDAQGHSPAGRHSIVEQWKAFVDRTKSNIPNAVEAFRLKYSDSRTVIGIAHDDITRSDSLKAPVAGVIELRVEHSKAVTLVAEGISNPMAHKYLLRFVPKGADWEYLDGTVNGSTSVDLTKTPELECLFATTNDALERSRLSHEAEFETRRNAWTAFENKVQADVAGCVSCYDRRASPGGDMHLGYMQLSFLAELPGHAGWRCVQTVEYKWDNRQWTYHDGQYRIVMMHGLPTGETSASLPGICDASIRKVVQLSSTPIEPPQAARGSAGSLASLQVPYRLRIPSRADAAQAGQANSLTSDASIPTRPSSQSLLIGLATDPAQFAGREVFLDSDVVIGEIARCTDIIGDLYSVTVRSGSGTFIVRSRRAISSLPGLVFVMDGLFAKTLEREFGQDRFMRARLSVVVSIIDEKIGAYRGK